jgi:hypothetical protein
MKIARSFYENLFNLKVTEDYGRNIVFDCGLSLQEDFDWLTGIPKSEIKNKENNCELYFEEEEFNAFVKNLKSKEDIVFLHDVIEYPWGQRVIRFYDPDNHLIEVGEPLKAVIERLLLKGMTTEEIAAKMDISSEDIKKYI